MRFRLLDILWLLALFAAGMATFGPAWGVFAAGAVAALVKLWPIISRARSEIAIGCLVVLALFALLLPAAQSARSGAAKTETHKNLQAWALALHSYHDRHGHFPPGASVSADGRTLHSWRALMLDFVGESALAKAINYSEPWHSPANAGVLRGTRIANLKDPRLHESPGSREATDFLAVVDEEAVLRPGNPVSFRDIQDSKNNTIVFIEIGGSDVPWYEPRDLTIDEAAALLCGETPAAKPVIETHHRGLLYSTQWCGDRLRYRYVAYADGHCEAVGRFTDRETARAYLTRAGGETLQPTFDTPPSDGFSVQYVVHWGRVWALALFVALALWPVGSYAREAWRFEPPRIQGALGKRRG